MVTENAMSDASFVLRFYSIISCEVSVAFQILDYGYLCTSHSYVGCFNWSNKYGISLSYLL
jgi:hypothetical protein